MAYSFKDIVNIAFILKVHTGHELLVLPFIKKQRGKTNYICICCDDTYNGFYKWKPIKGETLQTWKNKEEPCYVLPMSRLTKIAELEDIDSGRPIGRYINKIVAKMRRQYGQRRNG